MAKIAWVPKIENLTEVGVKNSGGRFVESGRYFSDSEAESIANRLNKETYGSIVVTSLFTKNRIFS